MKAALTFLVFALGASAGCTAGDPCTCPSAEESGAGTHFTDREYDFYHADGAGTLRDGTLELDASRARFVYRGPDGRMYRVTYAKGPLATTAE